MKMERKVESPELKAQAMIPEPTASHPFLTDNRLITTCPIQSLQIVSLAGYNTYVKNNYM